MARAKRAELVEVMRQRLVRAIGTGAFCPGDRLASTRELAAEQHADPRVVAAAYRQLEGEGLVELRARSGVYVRGDAEMARRSLTPPGHVVADLLASAALRGYSALKLAGVIHEVVVERPLRTLVIAATTDQGLGIARELREDFALNAASLLVERVATPAGVDAIARARLIVTTQDNAELARSLTAAHGIPHVIMSLRSDLFSSEWALWKGEPVHVIVLDPRFRRMLAAYLREHGAIGAVGRIHLADEDLSAIPANAPTYVTQAARTYLGRKRVPGMLIPPTRLFAENCMRELWTMIASMKLRSSRN